MSALGQSGRDVFKFRCPLYPRKRTFAHAIRMSALGQNQTDALQQITSLFDHLEQRGRRATRADLPGGEPNLTERRPRVHTERLENFRERTEAGEC